MSHFFLPRPSLRQRLACAAGALLTTAGLVLALLGAFVQASSDDWLLPTPDVLALVSQCAARPSRSARQACLHEVVVARLKPGANDAHLARGEPLRDPAHDLMNPAGSHAFARDEVQTPVR